MAAESLREFFVEELRDMYDGEKQLTRALPKMAKATESQELRGAFTSHLHETENRVTRLEQVFRTLGETVRGKKCDGIQGIVEEGKSAMEDLEGPLRDAALIAGAQKVEHYEIASYGTLAYFAELLGDGHRGRERLGAGGLPADDLHEPHHVGGAEEVEAQNLGGAPGGGSDLVDVER